jgi:hypothetical protein
MAYPEAWLRSAIELATGRSAYPVLAPKSAALPYIVFGRNSTDRESVLVGGSTFPVGSFEVDVFAGSYTEAKALADLVRIGVHGFNGTASGVTITQSLLRDEADGDPIVFDGQDVPTYSVSHTYAIRWSE